MSADPKKIIRPAQAREKLGICNTTLWQLVKDGKLPRALKIAPNCSGWLESDLDAYIEQCAKVSRMQAAL